MENIKRYIVLLMGFGFSSIFILSLSLIPLGEIGVFHICGGIMLGITTNEALNTIIKKYHLPSKHLGIY